MTSVPPIELKRHCRELSTEEMDGVVDVVADLIVNFLKTRSGNVTPMHEAQPGTVGNGRQAHPSIGNER